MGGKMRWIHRVGMKDINISRNAQTIPVPRRAPKEIYISFCFRVEFLIIKYHSVIGVFGSITIGIGTRLPDAVFICKTYIIPIDHIR